MTRLLSFLLLALAPSLSQADLLNVPNGTPVAQVSHGEVLVSGKTLKSGAPLATGDVLSTSDHGADIEIPSTHTQFRMGPDSEARILEKGAIELSSGTVRAVVAKSPQATHPTFRIRTPYATMGVRGTDFYAVVNYKLAESEIVVFDGTVDFANIHDMTDSKRVEKNHWGGIGGRFGARTHDLIELSAEAMAYFDKTSKR